MSSNDEQTNQFIQQMQMLEKYYSDLSYREGTFMNILKETTAAIESIKALSEKPESETLVPIGMGTFLPTKISSDSKVILNVGSGVAVEKDLLSAINYLEARLKEVQIALQDTSVKKQEAAAKLEQGKAQINQLMQARSSQNVE